MKKFLLLMLAAALILPAAAQQYQVGNSDFESWGSDANEPGSGWYSFSSANTNDLSSLLRTLAKNQSKPLTTKTTGRGGTGNAAHLISKNLKVGSFGGKANGNLTTGRINMGSTTPSDSKNYNYTDRSGNNKCAFTGRPDAFEYWAKFKRGESGTYKGRCHVIIHGDCNYKDPYETESNVASYKIAEATIYAEPCTEWTKFSDEFTYTGVTATTSYLLASFTTNETPGGSAGDEFDIDDIRLVYYSQLSSLTVDGVSVPSFDKDVYSYTVNQTYVEGTTSVVAKDNTKAGVATVEGSYDASTAVYTVTVKGQNFSEDATNYHTYLIQFDKSTTAPAELASVSVGGINVPLTSGVYDYTMSFAYNPGIAVEATATEGNTVEVIDMGEFTEPGIYDDDAKTISIVALNENDEPNVYTFSFTPEKSTSTVGGNYSGALSILLDAGGATIVTPLENTDITMTENQDGTLYLKLPNFQFTMLGMNVGDIYVPALTYNSSTGSVTGTRNVRLVSDDPEAIGIYLGHVPVAITMNISDVSNKVADASIDIITTESQVSAVTMFDQIHVDFVPFTVDETAEEKIDDDGNAAYKYQTITGPVTKASAQFLQINNMTVGEPMAYIDMSGATIANDVTVADLKQGAPADNNTIYYVPASATQLAGTNVVVGTETQEFSLNDKVTVNIPTGFTAASVTYDRNFTAGNWSTFVTPVAVDASDINGTVYMLSGITADAFEFTEVTGEVLANVPYLVKLDGANIFKNGAEGTVEAASETEDMTVTAGRVTQVGSYQTVAITSDQTKTWYGYAGGQFVKANSGTIKPYRTAFYVTGASSVAKFGMDIDTATGIKDAVLNIDNAPAYDLQGRRANNAEKGIYIIGGKKVILK